MKDLILIAPVRPPSSFFVLEILLPISPKCKSPVLGAFCCSKIFFSKFKDVIKYRNPGVVQFKIHFTQKGYDTLGLYVEYNDNKYGENDYWPYGILLAIWDYDCE